MHKPLPVIVLLIILLSLPVAAMAANELPWADGWSRPQELGRSSYSSRRLEYPRIVHEDHLLSLGYDSQDKALELTVYDLAEREIVQQEVLVHTDRELLTYDMAAGVDGVHVIWAEDGEPRKFFHILLDDSYQVLDQPSPIYSTFDTLGDIVIATGAECHYVIWSQWTREGVVMFASVLTPTLEAKNLGFPAVSRVRAAEVDPDTGNLHLLWNQTIRVEETRTAHYSLLGPELNLIKTNVLGNSSLNEHPSGSMVLSDGILHIIWNGKGGRHTNSVRYMSFVNGDAVNEAVWLSPTMQLTNQPDLAINDDGELRVVWGQNIGDNLEIFHGTAVDGQLANTERLTYATYAYIMPQVFVWRNHDHVLYEQISGGYRKLYLIDTMLPQEPAFLDKVGLDSTNVLGSIVYQVGLVFMMSGAYTIMSTIPVIIVTVLVFLLHKLLGGPKTKLGFMLQLFLVCVLVFFQLSSFATTITLQSYFMEGIYQVFIFLLITAIVLFLYAMYAKGNKDEPFVYGGAAFVWLFFWHFINGITAMPFVLG